MNEYISKEVVLDALDEIETEVADGEGFQYAKWRTYFAEMPSVEPKQKLIPVMALEEAIEHAEDTAMSAIGCECREEHRQLAEWLKILKKAKFEYDEAWRIITHPTPDVTYVDMKRAQIILEVFRGSLGGMK